MRRVFFGARRRAVVLAVIVFLLVPIAGFADDPQINPPHPQSVGVPQAPSFWQVLVVLVTQARVLPFVA